MKKTFLSIALLSLSVTAQTPKNIILMIGDGMGNSQLQAISMYRTGKDSTLLNGFPIRTQMTTFSVKGSYSADSVVADATYVKRKPTDSAASSTAFSTGVKTYDAAIGVSPDSIPLLTVVEKASQSKRRTGLVTTVPISHATPAGMVAHNLTRKDYEGIAKEMIEFSTLDLLIGGGHPTYDHDGKPVTVDSLKDYNFVGGKDLWERLALGKVTNLDNGTWSLVERKSQFDSLAQGLIPVKLPLLGVAQVRETTQEKRKEKALLKTSPTLTSLSKTSLRGLQGKANESGYFLMIEGGAIDWAGHANEYDRLIEEGNDFIDAIEAVVAWIEKNDQFKETLLIVTADHETGYLTAPISQGKGKLPKMTWQSKDHTNQTVPFFAKGPGSEKFQGTMDNAQVGKILHELLAP